jgi:hypothetical protein
VIVFLVRWKVAHLLALCIYIPPVLQEEWFTLVLGPGIWFDSPADDENAIPFIGFDYPLFFPRSRDVKSVLKKDRAADSQMRVAHTKINLQVWLGIPETLLPPLVFPHVCPSLCNVLIWHTSLLSTDLRLAP